ncbi:MAG: hypothetical protein N2D54_08460, partial [Chloroflexota bacterium]
MERTVPQVISEEIELYHRTYYSLLRSSSQVKIRSLEEAHAGMNSLLHPKARHNTLDMSAFIYSVLRLPAAIKKVSLVVLGQTEAVFEAAGVGDIKTWEPVVAAARRRPCFYDGESILACMIASRSDIDDIVPLLTAYQIEWNKFHNLLIQRVKPEEIKQKLADNKSREKLAEDLQLSILDLERLETIWGDDFVSNMEMIASSPSKLKVQLLNGSLTEYRRAINGWWHRIEAREPTIKKSPVYFVSSNPHSTINILTGFALQYEDELIKFVEKSKDPLLQEEWEGIKTNAIPSSRENFFYYILKKYTRTPEGERLIKIKTDLEKKSNILRIPSEHSFEIEVQTIPIKELNFDLIDPRLKIDNVELLKESDGYIFNIDYPLGMAAYQVLAEVSEHVSQILGVYVMGKSATLNGAVGDVMIPNVVYDGHSQNTYLFANGFWSQDIAPYLVYGSVLDNQKAVTVLGTFLQNHDYMDVFYRE